MTADRLGWLNGLSRQDAERELAQCCSAPSWVAAVAAGRPYPDLTVFLAASDDAFLRMRPADLSTALDAHPRIGERFEPTAHSSEPAEDERHVGSNLSTERAVHAKAAGWSRQEQAGAAGAGAETLAALTAGNRAYEKRFGHVFLICATGLSAEEMLAALRQRLGNDRDTETKIVREELRKITAVRLRKLLADPGAVDEPRALPTSGRPERSKEALNTWAEQSRGTAGATISTHVLDVTAGRPAAGLPVRLQRRLGGGWSEVGARTTDADGRVPHLEPAGGAEAGSYRLVFGLGDYFAASGVRPFFPEVNVDFTVGDTEHYHVPLLAGPYSYTTYRGS